MNLRFLCRNVIFLLLLKDNSCSDQIKEIKILSKESEPDECNRDGQIESLKSTIPDLESKSHEIKNFPEVQFIIQTPFSPNDDMKFETTYSRVNAKSEGLQPKEVLSPNANLVKEFKKTAEQFDKAMVLESKDHNHIMMEAVSHLKTTNDEFNNLFTNLKYEPTHVPEFYDYFDVLGFIDKSIVYIQSFLETLTGDNMANFFKTREGITDKIDLEFKSFEKLYEQAEKLYKDQKKQNNISSENDFFEDGLTGIESRKKFVYEHYIKYRVFSYQDYLKAIFIKHNKLTNLETYLKKVRNVICPLCEEDIKKHADLFKTTFKSVVKEVYEKLSECHDKENNILNFLFDILNGILKGIRECNNELEVINNIIENNGKQRMAE